MFRGIIAACCLVGTWACPLTLAAPGTPDMVVIISVDQLRRDRVNENFAGGIGRIVGQGRVFSDANLDHANTSTCPGHAVISTGVNPARAGIPGNYYIDRDSWERRYCFYDSDDTFRVIGSDKIRSPRNLRVDTLGAWLKNTYPEARVVSLGGKDRAAIALGGHKADGVFWFDQAQGRFTSSGYYMDRLPDYVQSFNGTKPLTDGVLSALPSTWEHDAGPWRADDYPGEEDKFERRSPHPLGTGDLEEVAEQFWSSPWQDRALLQLARKVIEAEALGTGSSPDLLFVALSATDVVGHLYGPFSSEAEDTLRRLDKELGNFLAWLDDRFGKGRVTVVLTSDHGVAALPEWQMERGANECPLEPGRVSIFGLGLRLYWYVYSRFTRPFGLPGKLVKVAGYPISVNRDYALDRGLDPDTVIAGLKYKLEQEPVIEKVWTRSEIRTGGEMARLYRNSLVDGRSGDLFVQPHRGCVFHADHPTGHGTPYHYDRDIPLIFYGWGVQTGVTGGEAHSVDIAPSLAELLELDYPANLDGRPLLADHLSREPQGSR